MVATSIVLEEQRDALGAEALDLEELERVGGNCASSVSRFSKEPRFESSSQHAGQAFADAGNFGDFALGVREDLVDALGIAFDGRCAVAIAADAEAIFAGDLHQVGGFGEHPRKFTIFHASR